MQEFNIDLGIKEIFSLKNFSFDIYNNGSADLQVNSIIASSPDIILVAASIPIQIIQNTSFTPSGYLKILYQGDQTNVYYIDFHVSWTNELGVLQTDVHRYWLNYTGALTSTYTEIVETNKIFYINNMLVLSLEFSIDSTSTHIPNIVLKSIDNEPCYVFPKVYRVTDKIVSYIFKDNNLVNRVINNKIIFFITHNEKLLKIKNVSYRSI